MITLDTYARHVYQYAPSATTEHLHRTVWEPLGLSSKAGPSTDAPTASHAPLYAVPPIATNVRCVGVHIAEQLRHLVSPTTVPDGTEWLPSSPTPTTTARYIAPFTLDRLDLPCCACVQPHLNLLGQWPPTFPLPSSTAAVTTDPAEVPLVIVVDVGAAEAVLRGSDLYAPGIVTASRVFFAGEAALVAFYAERVLEDDDNRPRSGNNPPPGMKKLKGEDAAVSPGAARWRITSALTAGITLPPAQYAPLLSEEETTAAALAQRGSFLVCVGCGTLFMGWKEVLGRRTRGVALRTDWTPQLQPSRATLRRLLHLESPTNSPAPDTTAATDEPQDLFFLQNYSSMVPVSLLVGHLPEVAFRRGCTVLDACAAPGGKTSLLLSLLQARAEREEGVAAESSSEAVATTAAAHPPFRVVCCERSRPRQEQLMKLLQQHFAGSGDYLSRVLEPHCIDTNKFLKKKLATAAADTTTVPPRTRTDSFDAILLDPPCTGLGLRPKLLPHVHSIVSIQQSADYQRKLLDSCVRHLRCSAASPGVLVYSTCTTTLEENEANVVHFLRTYPSLRLARATTPAHLALCGLSVTTYPELRTGTAHDEAGSKPTPLPALLLGQEILALQKAKEEAAAVVPPGDAPLLALRFMPRPLHGYDDPSEDSVGFFVAVFLCAGHDS